MPNYDYCECRGNDVDFLNFTDHDFATLLSETLI